MFIFFSVFLIVCAIILKAVLLSNDLDNKVLSWLCVVLVCVGVVFGVISTYDRIDDKNNKYGYYTESESIVEVITLEPLPNYEKIVYYETTTLPGHTETKVFYNGEFHVIQGVEIVDSDFIKGDNRSSYVLVKYQKYKVFNVVNDKAKLYRFKCFIHNKGAGSSVLIKNGTKQVLYEGNSESED